MPMHKAHSDAELISEIEFFESEISGIVESSHKTVLQKREEADCHDPL